MVFTVVFADVLDVVFTAVVVLTDEAVDTGAVVTVEAAEADSVFPARSSAPSGSVFPQPDSASPHIINTANVLFIIVTPRVYISAFAVKSSIPHCRADIYRLRKNSTCQTNRARVFTA